MSDTSWSQEKLPNGKSRCPRCSKIHDIASTKIAPPKKALEPGQAALQAYMEGLGAQTAHLRCPHCGTTYMLTHDPDADDMGDGPTDTRLADTLNAVSDAASPWTTPEESEGFVAPEASATAAARCPACGAIMAANAVICLECGYDLRAKRHHETSAAHAPAINLGALLLNLRALLSRIARIPKPALIGGSLMVFTLLTLVIIVLHPGEKPDSATSAVPPPAPPEPPIIPKPQPPDGAPPSEILNADDVYKAWEFLYERQENNLRWPEELGADFLKAVNRLGAEDELPVQYLELYQNSGARLVATLWELADLRRADPAGQRGPKPSAETAGDTDSEPDLPETDGGRRKEYLWAGTERPDATSDIPEIRSSRTGWEMEDRMLQVGTVEWNEWDRHRLEAEFAWRARPSTSEVRLAQEKLWVYETVLRIIRNTNQGATSPRNASVKQIAALSVGREAAEAARAARDSLQLGALSDTPAQRLMSDPGFSSEMGMGMEDIMGRETRPGPSGLLAEQYVDGDFLSIAIENGSPKHPYAEFKMVPVYLRLLMDQRNIPRLLAECANAAIPLRIRRIRLQPEKLAVDGPLGAPCTASARTRRGGPTVIGGGGRRVQDGAASSVASGLPVEIEAVAFIINPPDRNKLGAGSKGPHWDELGKSLVSAPEMTVAWLELLHAVNECLPRDPEGKRPQEIADRNELHIISLDCQWVERLEDWFQVVQSQEWYRKLPEKPDDPEQDDGPSGAGWVVQLTGYHDHNGENAGINQGAHFVRTTLITSLRKLEVTLPDRGSGTAESVRLADMGVSCPVLIAPGRIREETLSSSTGAEYPGESVTIRRFPFVVQFCWRPAARRGLVAASDETGVALPVKLPVAEAHYPHSTPWDPPVLPEPKARPMPPLLPLEELRVAAGRGAVMLSSSGRSSPTQGRRWAVLTGLVPFEKQSQAAQEAFEDTLPVHRQMDVPTVIYYAVERAEMRSASGEEPAEWARLHLRNALAEASETLTQEEIVSQRYLLAAENISLAFPLPRLWGHKWGAEVAHLPAIPMLELSPEDRRGSDRRRTSLGAPPATRSTETAEPYGLFRFFDFSVEPGKRYRYRVQLWYTNPNLDIPPDFLATEDLGTPKWLKSDWTNPSDDVYVPLDVGVLALAAAMPKTPVAEPTAHVRLTKFRMEDGLEVFEDFWMHRGQWLNCYGRKIQRQPPNSGLWIGQGLHRSVRPADPPASETVDFVTDCLLVDIAGGAGSGAGKADSTEPARILLLTPEGVLVIRHELDDVEEVAHEP